MAFAQTIGLDPHNAALQAVAQLVGGQGKVLEVATRAVAENIRMHLFDMDKTRPNKMGGKRTHYWAAMAKSIHYTAAGDEGRISITHTGSALHHFGGDISPGVNASEFTGEPTKLLTIPATPEAHGRRAGEFANLVVMWGKPAGETKPRPIALVEDAGDALKWKATDKKVKPIKGAPSAKAKDSTYNRVLFWLVRGASVPPTKDLLPKTKDLQDAMASAVMTYANGALL